MKKTRLLLLAVMVLAAGAFTSCSKDDSDLINENEELGTKAAAVSPIVLRGGDNESVDNGDSFNGSMSVLSVARHTVSLPAGQTSVYNFYIENSVFYDATADWGYASVFLVGRMQVLVNGTMINENIALNVNASVSGYDRNFGTKKFVGTVNVTVGNGDIIEIRTYAERFTLLTQLPEEQYGRPSAYLSTSFTATGTLQ